VSEPISSWDPYTRGCPSRDLLDQIGSKWAVLVLGELGRHGACRFTQLRQQLAGVSEKMLTQTLRTLERDGIVARHVTPSVPVRVDYELTPLGQSLLVVVAQIKAWAEANMDAVRDARDAYDAASD